MKTFITIVVVAALAFGGWWLFTQNPALFGTQTNNNATTTPETATTTDTTPGNASGVDVGVDVSVDTTPTAATVSHSTNGFSPATVTIKKGGTVTWNSTGGTMWVASAQHPTHTVYAGTSLQEHCDDATNTSFDQCKNSNSYSFTFTKVGTWNYHNHSNSSQFGKVIVVE